VTLLLWHQLRGVQDRRRHLRIADPQILRRHVHGRMPQ
jgi:hypothetical protein